MKTSSVVSTFCFLAGLLFLFYAFKMNFFRSNQSMKDFACCQTDKQEKSIQKEEKVSHKNSKEVKKRTTNQKKNSFFTKKPIKKEELSPFFQVKKETNVNNQSGSSNVKKQGVLSVNRSITLRNRITEDMTVYKYWSIKYKPSVFKIIVDGKELKLDETQKVLVSNDTIKIRYDYEFMKGYKKGNQDVEVSIPHEGDVFDISFSWLNNPRLSLKKA